MANVRVPCNELLLLLLFIVISTRELSLGSIRWSHSCGNRSKHARLNSEIYYFLFQGAKLVLFGCCPENSEIKLDPFQIYNKEVTIVGSLINPYTFPKAILLVKDMGEKYLNYDKLGVKKFQLQDYPAALESLKKGDIAKAVFQIHQSSS